MKKQILAIATAVSLVIGSLVVAVVASPEADRADCPGKMTCPLTGAEVCRDRCPLNAEVAGPTLNSGEKPSTPELQSVGSCPGPSGSGACCGAKKAS